MTRYNSLLSKKNKHILQNKNTIFFTKLIRSKWPHNHLACQIMINIISKCIGQDKISKFEKFED